MAIAHEKMRDILVRFPRVAHLLWRESLIDAAV
jgi:hypothetical protein